MAEAVAGPVVIGIGNPDRGDDAAGRLVARRLAHLLPPSATVIEHGGEVSSLLAHLETASAAWLIDACRSGAPVGTIRRIDAGTTPMPKHLRSVSNHALGLAEAIELARALGRLPARCVVYAIEGASFEHGAPVSPAVASAVENVAEQVADEIRRSSY